MPKPITTSPSTSYRLLLYHASTNPGKHEHTFSIQFDITTPPQILYTATEGLVQLIPRPVLTLNIDQYGVVLGEIESWIALVTPHMVVVHEDFEHTVDFTVSRNAVAATMTWPNLTAVQTWNGDANIIASARPAVELPWRSFMEFVAAHRKFYDLVVERRI